MKKLMFFIVAIVTMSMAGFQAKAAENLWATGNPTAEPPYYAPGWSPITTYTYEVTAAGVKVVLPEATTDRWQAQFAINTDIQLSADKYYDFSFDIKSSTSFTMLVKMMKKGDDNLYMISDDLALTAGQTVHFEKKGMPGKALDPVKILFDFGTNPANTNIEITNFNLSEGEAAPEPTEIPDLYIMGLNGNWDQFNDGNKMDHVAGTNVWSKHFDSLAEGVFFKFGPQGWDPEAMVFGALGNEERISKAMIGQAVNLKKGAGTGNLLIEPALQDVDIVLNLDLTTQTYTMTVNGTPAPDPTEVPDLWIMGLNNNWEQFTDANKLTHEAGSKVFTISFEDLAAGSFFKFGPNGWSPESMVFGALTAEEKITKEMIGQPVNLKKGAGTGNLLVVPEVKNALITLNLDLATETYTMTVTGDAVEPEPFPEEPDLYIIGLNNDWNNFPEENKFIRKEGTNEYTLELATLPAATNFKLAPKNWGSDDYIFGAPNGTSYEITAAALGTAITMQKGDGTGNFISVPFLRDVKIALVLDYTNKVYTLTLTGTEGEPDPLPEHPEFYLVGTMAQNADYGWDTVEDYKFTCDEATNVYTLAGLELPAGTLFKIAPKNWQFPEIVYGASTADQDVVYGSDITLVKGNDSANFKLSKALTKGIITFTYLPDGTSTMKVTEDVSVGTIATETAPAEYYNLQGIRVENPSEGIYIVRRGNVITKEIIRK